jgi:hypothetical protein
MVGGIASDHDRCCRNNFVGMMTLQSYLLHYWLASYNPFIHMLHDLMVTPRTHQTDGCTA